MHRKIIYFEPIEIFYRPANSTFYAANADADNSSVHWLFRINFMYYSFIGTLLVAVIGYPISILTGGTTDLDPKLLSPLFRRFYYAEHKKTTIELPFISHYDDIECIKEKSCE